LRIEKRAILRHFDKLSINKLRTREKLLKIGGCGAVEKVGFIKNIYRFVLRNKDDFSFLMVFQQTRCP